MEDGPKRCDTLGHWPAWVIDLQGWGMLTQHTLVVPLEHFGQQPRNGERGPMALENVEGGGIPPSEDAICINLHASGTISMPVGLEGRMGHT